MARPTVLESMKGQIVAQHLLERIAVIVTSDESDEDMVARVTELLEIEGYIEDAEDGEDE